MKQVPMSKFFISSFLTLFLCTAVVTAQDEATPTETIDSLSNLEPYGLRVGIDLSRPARTFYDNNYSGFEIVGDYRLTSTLFVAGELGNEERTFEETLSETPEQPIYNFTTNGSYIKIGVDINTYDNWFGENNSLYFGGRYAFSTFSQTVNEIRIFNSNRFFSPDGFPIADVTPIEFSSLNASWLEFIVGFKAELFGNIFMGASARLGFLITDTAADEFPNLWIPGFNRVTTDSSFGVSYNYTITYFLPFYKKKKRKKKLTKPQTSQN